jgi:hypothetical protein
LFLLPPKIFCIASLRKLFLAAAGAKQDGQKSGFILFAFLSIETLHETPISPLFLPGKAAIIFYPYD